MIRTGCILLTGFLVGIIMIAGCSTVQPGSLTADNKTDPIVGSWISRDSDSVTYFRFFENKTFDAWSHTGDSHPKYSFQYYGKWEPSRAYEYTTTGQHIGYGEVTALAIWRDLTIIYDPTGDTLAIPVYDDQVFTRLS
jgi:hypothetical protein